MKYLILIVSTLIFTSCKSTPKTSEDARDVSKVTHGDTLQNEFASAFRFIKYEDFYTLDILEPISQEVVVSYHIDQDEHSNSLNFDRIIALSATHIGMLEELQLLENVVGIASKQYICSEFLNKQVTQRNVQHVGELGTADLEQIVALKPTVLIFSGFNLKAPILEKLQESNVPTLVNYDWKETHPLGRAEWIKVFGLIANKQKEAETIFNRIRDNYTKLTQTSTDHSTVSVLAGTMYGDVFHAPAGNSYLAQLLKDAKVNYLYQNTEGTGSISLTLEEVIHQNKDTDYWINVAAKDLQGVLNINSNFKRLKAYKSAKLYSYINNVNCFWERSAIEPDIILKELIQIFQEKKDSLKYYKQLTE